MSNRTILDTHKVVPIIRFTMYYLIYYQVITAEQTLCTLADSAWNALYERVPVPEGTSTVRKQNS